MGCAQHATQMYQVSVGAFMRSALSQNSLRLKNCRSEGINLRRKQTVAGQTTPLALGSGFTASLYQGIWLCV